MNCLKAENTSIDGQCVKVIVNSNLVFLSLSFLSINQMMGREWDCICIIIISVTSFIYLYQRKAASE